MAKRFKIIPREQVKKQKECLACNGTGYYDHDGSPKCWCCNGTGYNKEVSREARSHKHIFILKE